MTFDRLKSILVDMNMFTIKGTMKPPNNRVIFDSDPLRIVVTPQESKIIIDGHFDWTFYLKHLTTKDLFRMLDEYFPHHDQTYSWTWVDKGFYSSEEWNNFKTKWLREEKIETFI
jgi:hypothetical protein